MKKRTKEYDGINGYFDGLFFGNDTFMKAGVVVKTDLAKNRRS